METIQKMQLRERISGTLLRLGLLVCIAVFVPTLLYVSYSAMAVGRLLFVALLLLVAMATLFLILLNESFRNALNAEMADLMPMVQNVYKSYSTVIYVLLAVGIILGVLTILFAIKEKNGKASRKRIISSSVIMAFTIIGGIVYMATKSKVLGA